MGYSPWGRKELYVTERLSIHLYRALSEKEMTRMCLPVSTPTPARLWLCLPLPRPALAGHPWHGSLHLPV